jgi:LysR family glycine cleavage system transcriptional activator
VHLASAVEEMRGGSLAGPLTVSVIPSFAHLWMTPLLPAFVKEPVDLGIRYGQGRYPGLFTHLLLTEEVFPVCAPSLLRDGRPLRRLQDLRGHTLLHERASNEPSLDWRTWLREVGIDDPEMIRGPGFTDGTMLVAAAIRGMGIALGRSALVAGALRDGALVRPLAASRPADFAYYVVALEGHERHPRVSTFLRWLDEQAAASHAVTEER